MIVIHPRLDPWPDNSAVVCARRGVFTFAAPSGMSAQGSRKGIMPLKDALNLSAGENSSPPITEDRVTNIAEILSSSKPEPDTYDVGAVFSRWLSRSACSNQRSPNTRRPTTT